MMKNRAIALLKNYDSVLMVEVEHTPSLIDIYTSDSKFIGITKWLFLYKKDSEFL